MWVVSAGRYHVAEGRVGFVGSVVGSLVFQVVSCHVVPGWVCFGRMDPCFVSSARSGTTSCVAGTRPRLCLLHVLKLPGLRSLNKAAGAWILFAGEASDHAGHCWRPPRPLYRPGLETMPDATTPPRFSHSLRSVHCHLTLYSSTLRKRDPKPCCTNNKSAP